MSHLTSSPTLRIFSGMWIGGFSEFGYCFERLNGILIFQETDIRFSQDDKNIQEYPRTKNQL